MSKKFVSIIIIAAFTLGMVVACSPSEKAVEEAAPVVEAVEEATEVVEESVEVEKMDKLVIYAPPGPMAIPLAYMAVNNTLSNVAEETELFIWENPDQLKAVVSGQSEEVHFVTLPSNAAAMFFNKGMGGQLLDISVWNILYMVGVENSAESLMDLKGEGIVVPFQGSMPDLIFQYVALAQDLDPVNDFDLEYAPNPQQAAQLLLAAETDYAVLTEPLVTSVLMQTESSDRPLKRVFAFEDEWKMATDNASMTAIAGTIALKSIQDQPDVIDEFIRQYRIAVEWMLENPIEAGKMAEEQLPELGFEATPMSASLQMITWDHIQAKDARLDLEAFLVNLMEISPEVIGGKLPDDGFYYPGIELED